MWQGGNVFAMYVSGKRKKKKKGGMEGMDKNKRRMDEKEEETQWYKGSIRTTIIN